MPLPSGVSFNSKYHVGSTVDGRANARNEVGDSTAPRFGSHRRLVASLHQKPPPIWASKVQVSAPGLSPRGVVGVDKSSKKAGR